jgi:hypothetical protein
MGKARCPYQSEADLCKAFIAWAEPQGWKAYAETAGWDVLLVADDGEQFGVQAKLRFNAKLLQQVLPAEYDKAGPDRRGILLPAYDSAVREVCDYLGIHYFHPEFNTRHGAFMPLPKYCDHQWSAPKRCELPEYVPDVVAGASAPVQLTRWKVAALRVCAILEIEGCITSKRIREFGIDPRRWTNPAMRWLKPVHMKHGVYERGERLDFDRQHPVVYSQILEEAKAAPTSKAVPHA